MKNRSQRPLIARIEDKTRNEASVTALIVDENRLFLQAR